MLTNRSIIKSTNKYNARNYHPLPVVLTRGRGVWVWDVEGNRYLDMLSGYSALNQGHCHPHIIRAIKAQAGRLTLTSRAFHNDRLGPFLKKLCTMTGYEKALPMNSGAEAVETAIKTARKWGYLNKKIPAGKAQIIVCANNFHGRTTTIVGFSTEKQYQTGFGPFTPGFKIIPYNDIKALKRAINNNTAAFLVEPIQGEGGVLVPDTGYFKACRTICKENRVLMIADEIQTGLGRTGYLLACDFEKVRPDIVIIGKALSGGFYPISAILCDDHIMKVFKPGDHGSTFGGNPLAAVIGTAALEVIEKEDLPKRARSLGRWFGEELYRIELKKPARSYCEKLMELGILAKETHEMVVRFAPPLVVNKKNLIWALARIKKALRD